MEFCFSLSIIPVMFRLRPVASLLLQNMIYIWKMYSTMKKLLLICIVGLLAAFPLFAEEKQVVSLRFSQQANIARVVLESDDNSIKNSIITTTLSNIIIEFPEPVELKKQSGFVFEASATGRIISIKPKNAEDVSFYKLGGPSRIVIDLKVYQKLPDSQQIQTGEKPKQAPVTDLKVSQKLPGSQQIQTGEKPKQGPANVAEKEVASKVIFLDSGHGGYDYGLISKDTKEKDLNLILTKDLSSALLKKGDKVFLTRKVDQSLSVFDRIILANSKKPDTFISLHSSASNAFVIYTAAADESATETSVKLYSLTARQGRYIEKSRALAKALGETLKGEFKGDVFLREMPLPILNSINSTAVLIEYPSLKLNTYDLKMRGRFINAVVKGILSHE
jgi:N-acetylmuramoyl-L-alanine amidase